MDEIASRLTARSLRQLLEYTNREMGRYVATVGVPRHFTMGAYQRYGNYRRRGSQYTKRKNKKFGHTNPNEFTGALRQIVLVTAVAGVTATQYGFRVKAKGTPQHRLWKHTREELEAVSASEVKEYSAVWQKIFKANAGTSRFPFRKRK
jgi:hypothetical protein